MTSTQVSKRAVGIQPAVPCTDTWIPGYPAPSVSTNPHVFIYLYGLYIFRKTGRDKGIQVSTRVCTPMDTCKASSEAKSLKIHKTPRELDLRVRACTPAQTSCIRVYRPRPVAVPVAGRVLGGWSGLALEQGTG